VIKLSDVHTLDLWEQEAEKAQEDFRKQCLLDTSLVFQVFASPAGQKLLERWKEVLISQPSAHAGDDLLTIGINEGYKNFIRTIINSVKLHEESQ
jgi:hypothetical protein